MLSFFWNNLFSIVISVCCYDNRRVTNRIPLCVPQEIHLSSVCDTGAVSVCHETCSFM